MSSNAELRLRTTREFTDIVRERIAVTILKTQCDSPCARTRVVAVFFGALLLAALPTSVSRVSFVPS